MGARRASLRAPHRIARVTVGWAVACVASACSGGDGTAPDVAAPAVALGDGDAKAQRCFAKVGSPEPGSDAPCVDGARPECARRCSEGEAAACTRLGGALFKDGDADCAKKLFALACDHGELGGCVSLAERLDGGREAKRVEQLLVKSCEGGHAPGCTRLGARVLEAGDAARGRKLLEQACDRGDAEGCSRAAALHSDDERIAFVRKGCNLGDPPACVELARALFFGIGVAREPQQAQQLLQQICSVDTDEDRGEGCFLLGQLLAAQGGGSGAQIDALYERACAKGHFDACTHVVNLHYVGGRYEKAVELSSKLVADNGSHWLPRYTRGMSLFDLGRFGEAVPDLERLCDLRPDWIYCQLWLYAARERAGSEGDAELQRAAKGLDLLRWPGPVIPYFLGKKSQHDILRAAAHPDRHKELEQLCEAYFYIGQKLMMAGKHAQARAMFQKAVDTGISNFVEYASARAELARMAGPP